MQKKKIIKLRVEAQNRRGQNKENIEKGCVELASLEMILSIRKRKEFNAFVSVSSFKCECDIKKEKKSIK